MSEMFKKQLFGNRQVRLPGKDSYMDTAYDYIRSSNMLFIFVLNLFEVIYGHETY